MNCKYSYIEKQYLYAGKQLRLRTLIVGAILLWIIVLSGCFPGQEEVLAPPLIQPMHREYQMHTVKEEDIVNDIQVLGSIISAIDYALSSEQGGRLDSILVKNGDHVEKGQVLVQLENGDLDTQIELAKINLEKVHLVLRESKDILRDVRKSQNSTNIRSAQYAVSRVELDVKASEIHLNQLIVRRQNSSLVSPIQGIVVYVNTNLKKGDYLQPYEAVVQIADPNNLQIVFNTDRLQDPRIIHVGMMAELEIGALKTSGKIVSSPFSAPIDAEESSRNIVVLDADEMPEDVEMGTTVNISIVLEKKEKVLTIPLEALRSYMGRDFVYVLEDGMRREITVEVGIRSATDVEIMSGLVKGQEVILR